VVHIQLTIVEIFVMGQVGTERVMLRVKSTSCGHAKGNATYINPDVSRCLQLNQIRGRRRLGKTQVAEDDVRPFLIEPLIWTEIATITKRRTLTRKPPPVRPELLPTPRTVVLIETQLIRLVHPKEKNSLLITNINSLTICGTQRRRKNVAQSQQRTVTHLQ
jgi:hypothetical protein